jgi:thioredoxin reductase
MSTSTVAVIGAGPYGIACAAHLRAAGVDTHVLGRPMEFWEQRMPAGMRLRSSWDASTISDPAGRLTLDDYEATRGAALPRPVMLADFVAYGRWFAADAVGEIDERRVTTIRRDGVRFRLALEDGDELSVQRVVLATGLEGFAHRPTELAGLPAALALHSVDVRDAGTLAGRTVLVVGGGQSAIELAALLQEAGARPEVVARAPQVRWLVRSGWLHHRSPRVQRLLYPPTDVGPPILNQIVAAPPLFRALPTRLQARVAHRSIRPAAAGWLRGRTFDVPISTGTTIVRVTPVRGALDVALSDGTRRRTERLVMATGFRPDITRHALLDPDLLAGIEHVAGYPRLRRGFESSVPGLHVVGALSAHAFGPLMRFVSGTWFTAAELSGAITRAQSARPVERPTVLAGSGARP